MSHKHWPEDHPFYERAGTCTLTKKRCDQLWTWYLHGHEGVECRKMQLPGNKTATCVLGLSPAELEERLSQRVKRGGDTGEVMAAGAGIEPAT